MPDLRHFSDGLKSSLKQAKPIRIQPKARHELPHPARPVCPCRYRHCRRLAHRHRPRRRTGRRLRPRAGTGHAAAGALLTARLPRKPLLLALVALFLLGNLVSALAGGYAVLLAGRLLTAVAHGSFFAVGVTVAAQLADKGREAQAIALMFAGLTLAMVVGVPLGSLLGNGLGWRLPFFAVAVLAALPLGKFCPIADGVRLALAHAARHETGAVRDIVMAGWYREEITAVEANRFIRYRVLRSFPRVQQEFTEIAFTPAPNGATRVTRTVELQTTPALLTPIGAKLAEQLYSTILRAGKRALEAGAA